MSIDIRRYMPEHMATASDSFTRAVIQAINANDENVAQLVQACIDSLFVSTANGKYLIQLGEQEGFTMPQNSGLDIRAYRILIPLMVSAPKQVRDTISEMVQAFYGQDRTRPSIMASVAEPYSLENGDNIIVETESGRLEISILATQVSDITNLTASELAAVLNTQQTLYIADSVTDRSTGAKYLRLSSKTKGTNASIRIVGGTIQNVVQLPYKRETTQDIGTTWNITKETPYTDVTKFTWDGISTNPSAYLLQVGDIVTIRGLTDGVDALSKLNGSYEIIDSGYDYFVIRNQSFIDASAVLIQPAANSVFFTSYRPSILFDQDEYAYTTETEYNTATVTVPAIPPLARRFLSGSAHLHGSEGKVLEFTRTSIKVELPSGLEQPAAENAFVLANNRNRYFFGKYYYRTTTSDELPEPTYSVTTGDDSAIDLPFTTPTLVGDNPFYAKPGDEYIQLTFNVPHGLYRGWGFTFANTTASGNFTTLLLDKEHVVHRVVDSHTIELRVKDIIGDSVLYSGVQFGPFDIYRHSSVGPAGADFYLDFPTVGDVTASGLAVGSVIKINPAVGTTVNAYYTSKLQNMFLKVVNISGTEVHVETGLGIGPTGAIITATEGYRDSHFGGTNTTYMFDQTSSYNTDNVMNGLKALFMAYTQSVNSSYVGSFIYDPLGKETTVTPSRLIAKTTNKIFKGSNDNIVFVDKVENVFGNDSFPGSGKVIIDYGSDKFEGPINYIAVISNNSGPSQIILDPSYRFKKTHEIGAQIQYIHDTIPFQPGLDGKAYPFYITGSAQARNTLFTLLELLTALGIFLEADVQLPDLLYSDTAIEPFA